MLKPLEVRDFYSVYCLNLLISCTHQVECLGFPPLIFTNDAPLTSSPLTFLSMNAATADFLGSPYAHFEQAQKQQKKQKQKKI